jgi:hypothetical protein
MIEPLSVQDVLDLVARSDEVRRVDWSKVYVTLAVPPWLPFDVGTRVNGGIVRNLRHDLTTVKLELATPISEGVLPDALIFGPAPEPPSPEAF